MQLSAVFRTLGDTNSEGQSNGRTCSSKQQPSELLNQPLAEQVTFHSKVYVNLTGNVIKTMESKIIYSTTTATTTTTTTIIITIIRIEF